MDKVLLETLRFLYQQDRTCKVSEIRQVVNFTGSNLQFLNHLHHLTAFPKYIIQQQDQLTITPDGKSLLLDEEVRLARTAEKDELEMNKLREERFSRDATAKRSFWAWISTHKTLAFWAIIVSIILGILPFICKNKEDNAPKSQNQMQEQQTKSQSTQPDTLRKRQ